MQTQSSFPLYTKPIPESNIKLEPLKWYDTTPLDPTQKEQFTTATTVQQVNQLQQIDSQRFLDYTGKHIVYPKESVEEYWKQRKVGAPETKSSSQIPTKYYEKPIETEQTQKFTIWQMVANAFTRTCFKNSLQFGVGLGVLTAAYANFRVHPSSRQVLRLFDYFLYSSFLGTVGYLYFCRKKELEQREMATERIKAKNL